MRFGERSAKEPLRTPNRVTIAHAIWLTKYLVGEPTAGELPAGPGGRIIRIMACRCRSASAPVLEAPGPCASVLGAGCWIVPIALPQHDFLIDAVDPCVGYEVRVH